MWLKYKSRRLKYNILNISYTVFLFSTGHWLISLAKWPKILLSSGQFNIELYREFVKWPENFGAQQEHWSYTSRLSSKVAVVWNSRSYLSCSSLIWKPWINVQYKIEGNLGRNSTANSCTPANYAHCIINTHAQINNLGLQYLIFPNFNMTQWVAHVRSFI